MYFSQFLFFDRDFKHMSSIAMIFIVLLFVYRDDYELSFIMWHSLQSNPSLTEENTVL